MYYICVCISYCFYGVFITIYTFIIYICILLFVIYNIIYINVADYIYIASLEK